MSQTQHDIFIDPEGRVRFIWDDQLAELGDEGAVEIKRVAAVEPVTVYGRPAWQVDCACVYGQPAKSSAFRLRSQALAVERIIVTKALTAGKL